MSAEEYAYTPSEISSFQLDDLVLSGQTDISIPDLYDLYDLAAG